MKLLNEMRLWVPIAIVALLTALFFFGEVNDLRFIRLCGLLSVTYSAFTWLEIQRLKDNHHEQT